MLADHVVGVPIGPVGVGFADALLVLPVGGRRTPKRARSGVEPKEVTAGSVRPASRVVTSCISQPLPSGSLNET